MMNNNNTFSQTHIAMIIAVPTRNGRVDDHFGHCDFFTLYIVSHDKTVRGRNLLTAPEGCGCKSNLIELLMRNGITHMLAGNMGEGAYRRLRDSGIRVFRGCSGDADSLVTAFLNGVVQDSGEACTHPHHHGGDCTHHQN